ncbi:efflux RND transporter periplasmic adaptor subunit [Novosphingobium sp.]|uniref:efflux RND transporter periplasmic adaptor subunit n=1 Tax=Novosphingobium sp. TaxID=1874826 RepID=UPI002735A839|nr:efflux RND transporter periplasmic adaptor subunit [Novosphingobium sp.]MDP3906087.1 HlyD family efflux transporter periplasmic adaptor subunit [Novosphingobium sp.]
MGGQAESSGRGSKLRKIVVMLVIVIGLFFGGKALGWWAGADDGALKLYGNVEIREVQLGFRVGGRIERLLVDEGDKVVAGQVLAELDTRPLQDKLAQSEARLAGASALASRDSNGSRPQQIAEAQAGLASAEAALVEARRQLERRQTLVGKGFISRAEVQTAEAGVDAARARVDAARAALSLAREGVRTEEQVASMANRSAIQAERQAVVTDLEDAVIRAAEPGQVLTRAREVGAIVQPGQTVMTLALTQPVRVRAYVAEPDLPKLQPGQSVKVRVDGTNQQWDARIGFISAVAEFTPKTVQTEQLRADLVYRVRLTVNDPKGQLRQGQPVTVIFPSGRD